MSITAQNLQELLRAAQNGNPRLKTILDGASAKNVNMDNAAKAAIVVATLMFNQNVHANTVSAATVRTFESVLYTDLAAATGIQLDAATHNELLNNRQQAMDYIQKTQGGNQFNSGGGSSNPFLANSGGSSNNASSNNPFLGGSTNTAASGDNPFLNTGSNAAQDENIFTSAPTAAVTAPAQPAPVVVEAVAQPVASKTIKAGVSMETYQDHELTVDYTTQAQPPRKTNESLKVFKLNGDWAQRVSDSLGEGKNIISFDDAELMAKMIVDRRTFAGHNPDTKDKFDEMLMKHHQLLGDIERLEEQDDIQVIMKKVNGTIKALHDNVVDYYRFAVEAGVPNTVKMDISALVACYLNRLEELVLNGFRIGSGQCHTPDDRRFVIKNTFGDLVDFSESVFNHYCDANGVCLEQDYFRELFLSVAAQLKKLRLVVQEGGEVEIEIATFEIVTAGNYTNYDKENVVTVNSFGPLAEVLSSIYEAASLRVPYASVRVQLPTGNIELLQSLDAGSPIRY